MVNQVQNNFESKVSLPNATASLVLGIVSICGSFIFGLIGLICGIIGLVLANKDKKLYLESEEGTFSASSYSTSNAGRVCSIIGIVFGAVSVIILIVAFYFFASSTSTSIILKN